MKRIAVLATLLLLIGACETTPSDPTNLADWRKLGFGIDIAEVNLSDGTRCVVIDDTKNAVITCDWSER